MNNRMKLQKLVLAAILTSLAVVLKIYLKIPVHVFGEFVKNINLSPAVVMYASIVLGPVYGGIVGGVADILGTLIAPAGAFNPLFTLTNALVGIIPALFFMKKKEGVLRQIISVVVTQLICSLAINTALLIILYGYEPMSTIWTRFVSTLIMTPIFAFVVTVLLRVTRKVFAPFMRANENQ